MDDRWGRRTVPAQKQAVSGLLLIAALWAVVARDCGAAMLTYQYDTTDFANPERGFFWQTEPDSAEFRRARNQDHVTLFRWCIGMASFRDTSLSAAFLAQVADGFAETRKAGAKVIPRFAYDYTPAGQDAPLDTVLKHIGQLGPVLAANRDVIAFMEAGFIGAWGEWHSSSNGLDNTESMRTILTSLLRALPEDRMVAVRTPMFKQDIFYTTTPLPTSMAFSGMDVARTGAHNDCLGASADDWGTYESGRLESLRNYLHSDNRYVPVGGETCNPSSYSTCTAIPSEMQRMRWDALNLNYHPGVIDSWRTDGCFGEVSRMLGYRFVLLSASLQDSATPGGHLAVSLRLTNVGWGKCYNPRGFELVLRESVSSTEVVLLPGADPRWWLIGDTVTVTLDTVLPASMAEGDYAMFVNLPDTVAGFHDRPDYAIRLANSGVWEQSTGYNRLNHTLRVRGAASVDWPRRDGVDHRTKSLQSLAVYDLQGRCLAPDAVGRRTGVCLVRTAARSGARPRYTVDMP